MQIELYVPTAQATKPAIAADRESLVKAAGGVTVFSADGGWFSPSGEYIAEPVVIFRFVFNRPNLPDLFAALLNAHIRLLRAAGEQSVLVVKSPATVSFR